MLTPLGAQWMLLGCYMALFAWAAAVGLFIPRLRPLAFCVGLLAFTHVAYYYLFLVKPEILDGPQTMCFSIALRYQVMFTAGLVLALAVRLGRWR